MTNIIVRAFYFFSFAVILCISISTFFLVEANNLGFISVDLIHRDFPASPSYVNSSLTHFQRVRNALKRSHSRVKHFASACMSPKTASSEIFPEGSDYQMKIKLGTPPVDILAIADTGSDLIWTQCAPCKKCFKQNGPLFKPKKSSTYKVFSCHSKTCQNLIGSLCTKNNTHCKYEESYGDRSFTNGVVATETITLGTTNTRPVLSLPRTIIGCGFSNGGTFQGASGVVGLGGGPLSLVSQLGSKKFSYCLVPLFSQNNQSSRIHFGANAIVSGTGVVSTPIFRKPKTVNTFYFLTLKGFTVGHQKLKISNSSSSSASQNGNIIIDSGTTLTYIPSDLYSRLESAVKSQISSQNVSDPLGYLSLCYRTSKKLVLPVITVHFTGADLKLRTSNTFIDTGNGVTCLAFAPENYISIFGNVAQTNFLVGYDLRKRTVSFKRAVCGRSN